MPVSWEDMRQVEGYKVAETATNGPPNYYGYVNAAGEWYIMKETATAAGMSYTYTRGTDGFAAAWLLRADAGTTYAYFNVVF